MQKLLVLPISAYFGYTGYVLITEPTTFNKQLDKAVLSLPSMVTSLVQTLLKDPMTLKGFGGLLLFVGVLTFLGFRPLLRLVAFLQFILIGVIVAGIVEQRLEMQALSEALERIAYHLCLVGMVLISSSFSSATVSVEKPKEKISKKKVERKSSSSDEEEEEDDDKKKPVKQEKKETTTKAPKQKPKKE